MPSSTLPQRKGPSGPVNPGGGGGSPTGPAGGDLSGTYPDPEVVALHETSGPDRLEVGAIADGDLLVRTGSSILGASFGGQCQGPVDANTVVGVTETSGPTALAMGAVADGQLLGRVGAGVVGVSPSSLPVGTLAGQCTGPGGSNSVVGITETSGPTALAIGSIADGYLLRRSGASVVGLNPASLPVGTLAGQCTGPGGANSVVGITETSGPTALAIGSIADGYLLRRSGANVVGLNPASLPAGTLAGQCTGPGGANSVVGITETSGPTALTIGAIPDGTIIERAGTVVQGIPVGTTNYVLTQTGSGPEWAPVGGAPGAGQVRENFPYCLVNTNQNCNANNSIWATPFFAGFSASFSAMRIVITQTQLPANIQMAVYELDLVAGTYTRIAVTADTALTSVGVKQLPFLAAAILVPGRVYYPCVRINNQGNFMLGRGSNWIGGVFTMTPQINWRADNYPAGIPASLVAPVAQQEAFAPWFGLVV